MAVSIVGFAVELARLSFGVWTFLVAFAALVGVVSLIILREFEK